MADGGGGGEGGVGVAEWQPIYDRLEVMVTKSEARAEALAADRARLQAADRVHRESLEAARKLQRSVEELRAAAREKDAEMERLRAEAADARKKLQADAGRKMRWEAAYVDLLLGANQKLAELRDGDLEDSRTCTETPNSKEVGSCSRLCRNTVDQVHIASDLSKDLKKLKQAYQTLSSKKDKEVSALLSEKDSVHNQLSIMQQDYAAVLKNKKVEAAHLTEAALKLQQSVDELKVLAQKKDDEIARLHSMVKEKDVEIQRLKGCHPESIQKHNKDISETDKSFRSGDPAVRSKSKINGLRQMVEDYISQTETVQTDRQDGTHQKRRLVSSRSNDDEQSGSDEDSDGQSGNDEASDEQSTSDEHDEDEQSVSDGEETMNNLVQKPLGNPKRKRDACNARVTNGKATVKAIVKTQWYWSYMAPPPLCSHTREVQIRNGRRFVVSTGDWAQYVRDVNVILADQPDKHEEFIEFLCNFENWRIEDVARTMALLLDGHPKLIHRFNRFLPKYWQIEIEEVEEEEEKHHPDESGSGSRTDQAQGSGTSA